jgi:hypothetical protein
VADGPREAVVALRLPAWPPRASSQSLEGDGETRQPQLFGGRVVGLCMDRFRRSLIMLLTAATACVAAAPALAQTHRRTGPITRASLRADRECARTGKVTGRYSPHVLSVALRLLPADVAEYTNCASVLRTARKRAAWRGRQRRTTVKHEASRAVRECARTGTLKHRYSAAVLTVALRSLPSDIAQYTDCVAVLRAARVRAPHHYRADGRRKVPAR